MIVLAYEEDRREISREGGYDEGERDGLRKHGGTGEEEKHEGLSHLIRNTPR